MGQGFNVGKLFGIQFRLHFTWFIIFIWITLTLVHPNYSQPLFWVTGIVASLLLFGSVIAHELAHSLTGRANGIPIESITLFIFGGVAQMTKEASKPGAELKMAAAGPICSFVLSGLFALIMTGIPEGLGYVREMLWYLTVMNALLGLFNLIPGFPLDGGRIFRALMWQFSGSYTRSTRIAARAGQIVGYIFMAVGVGIALLSFFLPIQLSWFDGLWTVFIGWFLVNAASASYRQVTQQEALQTTGATEVTSPEYPIVPPNINLN